MAAPRRILLVVGTRPNFMKIAPILRALGRDEEVVTHLVHTGQHYDDEMSRIFLDELSLPEPDSYLGVGSGSRGQQIARVISALEPVLHEVRPDVVVVPGDVNSTLGAALAAAGVDIPVAHVEAGLRSFDRRMPEEVNRVLVDALAALLFTHSPEARGNLLAEGRPPEAILDVGNTMIDTLEALLPRIRSLDASRDYGLEPGSYVVATLHRPGLVDGPLLGPALDALVRLSRIYTVAFAVHPRTRARIEALGRPWQSDGLRLLPPLGYLEFVSLMISAAAVLTDSGGVQEETTYLGIPCFTLRDSTERPVTVELGTNVVLGVSPERVDDIPRLIDEIRRRPSRVPPLWDGRAAERIADALGRVDRATGSGLSRLPIGGSLES